MSGPNDITIKLGLDDAQLPAPVQRVNAAIGSIGKTGEISARQTAAAMRTLPAQLTDVATQLAGGQNPLLILLQQGGQIKDSFGGLGPAISALRASITPVAISVAGLAAGVAAVTTATLRGREEFNAYRRAILLTGNEAGVTVGKLDALARTASSRAGGTQGNAAGIAAQLVGTGDVSRASLNSATEAAIRLERNLGVEVGKTVAAFAELGRSPLQAAVNLNKQTNFLTLAIYEQIRALQQQGRTAEAAAVAQEAYATAAIRRGREMQGSLGTLKTGWLGIKDAAAQAWDAMLGIGRERTVEEQLADVQKRLAAPVRRGGDTRQADARREALRQREGELQEQLRLQQRYADKEARDAAAVRAKAEADAKAAAAASKVSRGPGYPRELAGPPTFDEQFPLPNTSLIESMRRDNQSAAQEFRRSEIAAYKDIAEYSLRQTVSEQEQRERNRREEERAMERTERDQRKRAERLAEDAGRALYDDTRDALSAAFRDSNDPIEAFGAALANTIYTRATTSLIDALASAAVGADGRGGMLGDLLKLAGAFAGSGSLGDGIDHGDGSAFPPLATGTNFVPRNMIAQLHRGEAVVPARYNPAAGGAGAGVTINHTTNVTVDARSDQAQVAQLVFGAVQEGNTALVEDLQARGMLVS